MHPLLIRPPPSLSFPCAPSLEAHVLQHPPSPVCKMLPKFLACGLAALALVRATPFQVNVAVSFDTAVTAGIEAGNYYLVNVGRNETLFGEGRGPVFVKSIPGTPGPLAQWKVEPGAGSNEYKFLNIGLDYGTAGNNGCLYFWSGARDQSRTHAVTPVQGKADTFIVRTPPFPLFSFFFFFPSGAGSPHSIHKDHPARIRHMDCGHMGPLELQGRPGLISSFPVSPKCEADVGFRRS
ncbi:hypothetical protein DFH09DRAFT_1131525 [Mycena vulgaris]|nr:hypothetical protein DFH09DRAFT_1131525 [Mycena vulgaris]